MWIVAGLGNPGKQYIYTWHNMGYLAVDMLADKHGIFLGKEKYKSSEVADSSRGTGQAESDGEAECCRQGNGIHCEEAE